jgi:hypothetical protein
MSVTELVCQSEMSALNADAPENMPPMSVTELVFQPEMSALNADAPENMPPMSVTELVCQSEMSALNADAPLNMLPMFVTELVSQREMSALNADAPENIYPMSVTDLVSHPEMSAMNAHLSRNKPFPSSKAMSVTKLTSQSGISSHPATPHRAVEGSLQPESSAGPQHATPVLSYFRHSSTAVLRSVPLANGTASAP